MNKRHIFCALGIISLLSACQPVGQTEEISVQRSVTTNNYVENEETGLVAKVHWISPHEQNRIPYVILDSVNALRSYEGLSMTKLSPRLIAASRTHARDMSVQNRPWHFGSDGSSPIDRAENVGYMGKLLGENISESFEGATETLAAWMDNPRTRSLILNPETNYIGIGWFQENTGKIWWSFLAGT